MTGRAPRTEPPYLRIAAEIRARIAAGELRAGDRVPSTRQITREWGVAKATASKVLETLRREGVVRAVSRVGTVVSDRELSQDRIAAAAIAIADERGLAGLSMRGVAGALGSPTMSLYRHVRSKDELLDLMADAAIGEIDLPVPPPGSWRAALELAARLQWRVYRRHPWLPFALSLTHPQALPNMVRHGEWMLRAAEELGLDPETRAKVHFVIVNYVRGTATNLELETAMEQRTGLSGGQWMTAQLAASGDDLAEYPALSRAAGRSPEFRIDIDDFFEFGLQRVLDGVAALVLPK
ncbi:TetR/AcrR family transcriptional regulator C-terminal domain-containing protein [Saccharopolyspora sp. 5N708]|uniref:TetR/AcrR family transcriptional regulator C-terminal domain-containing protein n=1 Tax=Saccharopolyspora sp. 5N708 TaxID=3457424 RepID=UPI003FD325F0